MSFERARLQPRATLWDKDTKVTIRPQPRRAAYDSPGRKSGVSSKNRNRVPEGRQKPARPRSTNCLHAFLAPTLRRPRKALVGGYGANFQCVGGGISSLMIPNLRFGGWPLWRRLKMSLSTERFSA